MATKAKSAPADEPPPIDLARLPKATLAELRRLWAAHIGCTPPPQRRLIIRELAWHAQEEREGGFDAQARRLLQAAMRAATSASEQRPASGYTPTDGTPPNSKPRQRPRTSPKLPIAVRLVREWGGQQHEVTVVEHGRAYRYRDRTFKSLTEIAREITGSHWSGPRFFGLVSKAKNPLETVGKGIVKGGRR